MEKKNYVILAQDPSFAKLAFSLYDGDETIYMNNCTFELGDCVGFEKVFIASRTIFNQYSALLQNSYGVNDRLFIDKVFTEVPPPNGTYSAGLFALDTFLVWGLYMSFKSINEIWSLPPSYLMVIHNCRKYKKGDSTTLAKYLMNEVLKDKFQFKFTGAMNADRAESFIFLLRAFVKYNINDSAKPIVEAISGFLSDSEKLIVTRKV